MIAVDIAGKRIRLTDRVTDHQTMRFVGYVVAIYHNRYNSHIAVRWDDGILSEYIAPDTVRVIA